MQLIDYAIVVVYLLTSLIIGLWLEKQASKGIDSYFLCDRRLPWWALGASGMASNIDVSGTMINTAFIYALGTQGFFIEIRGGVTLVMAFLMIFMGKWNRRAGVMTLAEWMPFRFGKGWAGDFARIISAVSAIVITIGMISYFAIGTGKFFGEFLGMNPRIAAILIILITMIYTTASGLYGTVWTDVFQGLLILGMVLYVCFLAVKVAVLPPEFLVSVPMGKGLFQTIQTSFTEWTRIVPPATIDMPGQYSIYNLFGVCIMFYLFKVILEGSGGTGGYMLQRYLAAKNDKEAGLLSLFWTFLLSFRWPLIGALAMLGIYYGTTHTVIQDPELVLPIVINHFIPVGLKGLMIACLMAAAMSTLSSTVNAAAAYWVKDIYQAYIHPKASEKTLVRHSRWSSAVMVILGILFSYTISNINEIWGWITMGIGAGMFIPLILRWYWWRFNGCGFAWGTLAGMVAAVITKTVGGQIPEYVSFMIASGSSLAGCVIGTYLSKPTETAVLENFYKKTRPFGWWGSIRKVLPEESLKQIREENRRDIFSTFFAVPWQIVFFLFMMSLVFRTWSHVAVLGGIFAALSTVLYFSWFRHLSKEVKIPGQG